MLVRIAEFDSQTFRSLYHKARRVEWNDWISPSQVKDFKLQEKIFSVLAVTNKNLFRKHLLVRMFELQIKF